jgi:hypothetical protein
VWRTLGKVVENDLLGLGVESPHGLSLEARVGLAAGHHHGRADGAHLLARVLERATAAAGGLATAAANERAPIAGGDQPVRDGVEREQRHQNLAALAIVRVSKTRD